MGIEETILRDVQNRIEQNVFGPLTNSTQTPELILENVKTAVDEINKSLSMQEIPRLFKESCIRI